MKITYDKKEAEDREIVAFISGGGHLCIKGATGESIVIGDDCAYEGVLGFFTFKDKCEVVKTFYRGSGDSVTITF